MGKWNLARIVRDIRVDVNIHSILSEQHINRKPIFIFFLFYCTLAYVNGYWLVQYLYDTI